MSDLLSLTVKKNILAGQTPETISRINLATVADSNVEVSVNDLTNISRVNYSDKATLNGKDVDLFGVVSDERLNEIYSGSIDNVSKSVRYSTTYKDLSFAEISKIKRLIYEMHTKDNSNGDTTTPGDGGTTVGGATTPDGDTITPSGGETSGGGTSGNGGTSSDKKSFIREFADTQTMFEYLNGLNSEISYETGITRAQLVALTQNDDWEDSNKDFFGTLNRIFDALDIDDNSILLPSEIETIVGKELGDDYNVYISKVNNYATQLQTEYASLSDQEKLEFAIERTREYFEAAGLTRQLAALNRLLGENDIHNSITVGQISMKDFEDEGNGYITLGCYTSTVFPDIYTDQADVIYDTSYFAFDNDDDDCDRGITLNKIMLNWEWYELVDTLVHEITHATAYSYYPDPSCEPASGGYYLHYNISQLEYIKQYLSDDDYQYYKDNFNSIVTSDTSYTLPDKQTDAYSYFVYLLSCQSGEYAAYQVDADYVDSIGGDLLTDTSGNNVFSTAASGSDEKTVIENHINAAYNTAGMSIADYASTYGFAISQINDNDNDGYVSYGDTVSIDGEEVNIYEKEAKPDYTWWSYNGTLA